jgi:hypothetical protein
MSDVFKLKRARDEYQKSFDHVWTRRTTRYLRDMRMLGADNDVLAELFRDLLFEVQPSAKREFGC